MTTPKSQVLCITIVYSNYLISLLFLCQSVILNNIVELHTYIKYSSTNIQRNTNNNY